MLDSQAEAACRGGGRLPRQQAEPRTSYVQCPCCRQRWQVGTPPCWLFPKLPCRSGAREQAAAAAVNGGCR